MADLLTHSLCSVAVGARLGPRAAVAWTVAGGFLPDLCSRSPRILVHLASSLGLVGPEVSMASWLLGLDFLHTPVGALLLSLLVALWWPALALAGMRRAGIAGALALGSGLHLALDALQSHLQPGYALLYPLSAHQWEAGWLDAGHFFAALPLLFLVALVSYRAAQGRKGWADGQCRS